MKIWCKEFRTSRWSCRENGNKSQLYLNPEIDKWNFWHTYWGKRATNMTSWNQISKKEAAISNVVYMARRTGVRNDNQKGILIKRNNTKEMMWRIKINVANSEHRRSVNLYQNDPLKWTFMFLFYKFCVHVGENIFSSFKH